MTDLISRDKEFIWHPFTQHKTECEPIALSHAKDASLFDVDGNEIIDLISSWWTITHGHSHPAINDAMMAQANKMSHVMFSGFTHEPAVQIAESLSHHLGGNLSKVFFSDNGSTSVEVALKVAYQYWQNKGEAQRTNFIAFDGAYHGDTFGAMAVGKGSGFFTSFDELLCQVHTVPYGETWLGDNEVQSREDTAITALQKTIDQHGNTIAAIIMEPLFQGAGGMKFCRPEFVKRVVETARAAGILVIFDEIATGFGRTGSLFAHQQCDVKPDMICLSKGLTAGTLPLSVTVIDAHIFDAFLGDDFSKALAHGHSFTGNPLACSIANRSLALFEEEQTLERIKAIEASHQEFAQELLSHSKVKHVRVCGSLLAFDIDESDAAAEGTYKSETSLKLRDFFLAEGLNIRPLGPVVYLMPPYSITKDQLKQGYEGLLKGLELV
ncbi:MAG: adenosylmethionine--8-amino-7-oxononanoate aminotransferase BioA [Methyloligella sp.]|nr:MAG: adenosylmethionine--8-amino-7-oxononanoate aminotransferase BioA [Methyloligella sp.]